MNVNADHQPGEVAREWKRGWSHLIGCAVAVASGGPMFLYTQHLFVGPLTESFGWTRTEIAFAGTLGMITSAVMMPVMGALTDKYGSRIVGLSGLTCKMLLYFMLAAIFPNLYIYYSVVVLISVMHPATNAVVFTRPIVEIFRIGRGTAIAILLSGPALLLIPLAPLLTSVLEVHGWRAGYVLLGLLILAIGLPFAFLGTRRVKGEAGVPVRSVDPAQNSATRSTGQALGEAIRHPVFWFLATGVIFAGLPLGGVFNQLTPLLRDSGLGAGDAAMLASVFAAAMVIGRCTIGFLLDILNPYLVAICGMLIGAAACLVAIYSPPSVVAFGLVVLFLGCAVGATGDVEAFFVARHFGLGAFSTVYGALSMCLSFSLGLGALMFGVMRDVSGAYESVLLLSSGLFVLASFMFGMIGRYDPSKAGSREIESLPA